MTFSQFVKEREEVLMAMYRRVVIPSGSKSTFEQFCWFVYQQQ